MTNFIDNSLLYDIVDHGQLVGEQTPTRESKGMWYEIYRYDGNVYAIIQDMNAGVVSGELIAETDISKYI